MSTLVLVHGAYLVVRAIHPIDDLQGIWVSNRDVIWADADQRAMLLVKSDTRPWHVPFPHYVQPPQAGEAGQKRSWKAPESSAVSGDGTFDSDDKK